MELDEATLPREYIKHISAESNKICLAEGKKTITPDFIYKALKSLHFENHLEVAKQAQQQCDEEVQKRNKIRHEFQQNFSQEELQLEQQKIFDESAREFQKQQEMMKTQQENGQGGIQQNGGQNNVAFIGEKEEMKNLQNNLFESKSMDDEDYEN